MVSISDILLDDLRAINGRVNRLLRIGLSFAIVGQIYIIEPYFRYVVQERKVEIDYADAEKERDRLNAQLEETMELKNQAGNTLKSVREQVSRFPDHLRDTIREIDDLISSPESIALQQQPRRRIEGIRIPENLRSLDDAVPFYVKQWCQRLTEELKEGVLEPVSELTDEDGQGVKDSLRVMVEDGMKRLEDYFNSAEPGFWRSYTEGKVPFAQGIHGIVGDSFDPIQVELEGHITAAEKTVADREEALRSAKARLTRLKENRQLLESRLNSLESPFGRLPLSPTDLLVLFPLLVTVFLVMVASAIGKSSRLYLSSWKELGQQGGDADVISLRDISDCWYLPPYVNWVQPTLLFGALVIGIAVFVRASILISLEPSLFASSADRMGPLGFSLFVGMAVIAAVINLGCVLWVYKSIRHVSQVLSSTAVSER